MLGFVDRGRGGGCRFGSWGLGGELGTEEDRTLAEAVGEMVEGLLQALVFLAVVGIEEVGYDCRGGHDTHKNYARFLIQHALPIGTAESRQRILQQFLRVGGGNRQSNKF